MVALTLGLGQGTWEEAQHLSKCNTLSDMNLALVQAKKFLGGQDWIRARTALYDFYNRDALAQQRRCIIPQQVSPPWSCPSIVLQNCS